MLRRQGNGGGESGGGNRGVQSRWRIAMVKEDRDRDVGLRSQQRIAKCGDEGREGGVTGGGESGGC
jgi:hypothetical protein